MYFRLNYEIQVRAESKIQDGKHYIIRLPSFQIDNENGTQVTFRKRTFEEAKNYLYQYEDIVQACFEETLSKEYEECFKFLHENAIYPDNKEPSFRYRDSNGCILPWPKVNSSLFPTGLIETVQNVRAVHHTEALDIIKFARWRLNKSFSDKSIRRRGSDFSVNGIDWYPMPYAAMTITVAPVQPTEHCPIINNSQKSDIELAASSRSKCMKEPFYRYLFHEAFEQCEDSPLSAIVMAMAVVESAAKQCLIYHDKARKESLDKEESPSPYKLIKEINSLRDEDNFIPKRIRNVIHQATEVRNKIVHTGRIPNSSSAHLEAYRENPHEKAYELLTTVEELMWLLEYGRGKTWALDYISNRIEK
jgi:hypothetical protein